MRFEVMDMDGNRVDKVLVMPDRFLPTKEQRLVTKPHTDLYRFLLWK